MKTIVAVIDAGGRGSALIDKYAQSRQVDELIAIPGNDLMQLNTTKPVHTFPQLKTTSKKEILEICSQFKVALVDVSQDNAVECGVSDLLRENGFKVVGPSRAAGQIEWDKAYSREILEKTGSPQPEYRVFESEEEGVSFINSSADKPRFIKAFGLAEGKGALPAKNNKQALKRIKELRRFGDQAQKFLIEDWLIGEEFSAFAISDGFDCQFLGFAQDHKRVLDGDQGENTGGMGCSTPPLIVSAEISRQSCEIITDTLDALNSAGRPYQGIIYLGGIVVEEAGVQKVYVIEFNARWGDPEVECLLPGIKTDWFKAGLACAEGTLSKLKISTDSKCRVAVVCASAGYPGDYSEVKGKEIKGIDQLVKNPDLKIYGAGVKVAGSKFIASGGRLFHVVGEGLDVVEARESVYKALKAVSIPDPKGDLLHYRTDIGFRDVNRLK